MIYALFYACAFIFILLTAWIGQATIGIPIIYTLLTDILICLIVITIIIYRVTPKIEEEKD